MILDLVHGASSSENGQFVDGIEQISPYHGMVPNLAFNIAMLVIWSLLLAFQASMVWLRQYWISTAFICAGVMEVIGYIGRVMSHYNVYKRDPFLMQMICLTIAPVFTMGGIYYQLAKLIEIFGHRFSLLPSPMAYSYIFLFCDIVSLVIQALGGGSSASADAESDVDVGDNIFIAGLAIQVASMIIFMAMMFHLFYMVFVKTRLDHTGATRPTWALFKIPQSEIDYLYRKKFYHLRQSPDRWVFRYFPHALASAVMFIFVRCCYRLAELVQGWGGDLITHENYFIILDALMMAIATTLLTVFHPGLAFKGREVSIPITRGRVDPETIEEVDKEDKDDNDEDGVQGKGVSPFRRFFRNPLKRSENAEASSVRVLL